MLPQKRGVILRERTPETSATTGACARPKDLCRVATGQPSGAVQGSWFCRQDPSVGAKVLCISRLRRGASLRMTGRVKVSQHPLREAHPRSCPDARLPGAPTEESAG